MTKVTGSCPKLESTSSPVSSAREKFSVMRMLGSIGRFMTLLAPRSIISRDGFLRRAAQQRYP